MAGFRSDMQRYAIIVSRQWTTTFLRNGGVGPVDHRLQYAQCLTVR